MSLVAVAALALVAIAWVPRQAASAESEVDRAELDAQIDARLHALLGKMIEQARRDASTNGELASR
ncbi:MAG TPA: hypothetical protein DFS52_24180 [Myxococcales bacterium]|nr:hypothetical protein [Myxococcales bacterium]